MRLFVTGGAGFIGSHTVEALVAAGHRVTVWDDLSTGKRENLASVADRITFLPGDIRDGGALGDAVATAGAEAILHLAAVASVVRSVEDPITTHAINVAGTVNVLEAARRAGVPRVAFACSAAIFGNDPQVPKRESSAPAPASPYGLHKLEGEWYLSLYSDLFQITTVSLRYFNIYGPRQDPKSPYSGVISIFTDRLLANGQPQIHGDGAQTRDFVYVADVADINHRALTAPLTGHHRFNVGTGRETTVRMLYDRLAAITGQPNAPGWGPARTGDVHRSYADPAAAAAALGFSAHYALDEGLAELVRWSQDRRPE